MIAWMFTRQPIRPGGFGGGLTRPVPPDIWWLLGVVFVTYSLRFFASTAWLPALLELTPDVWQRGFLWQLATYPFVGVRQGGIWLVITLLILYMFSGEVRARLGRRGFWQLLLSAAVVGSVVAVVVQLVANAVTTGVAGGFPILQGERMLMAIVIAAFATLAGDAVIYLFFVLPIKARWFLGLELLFAFLAFLTTRDLAGMLGLWAAVGFTFFSLEGRRGGRGVLREAWLRLQEKWFRLRLDRARRKRGLEVLPGGRKDDWLH